VLDTVYPPASFGLYIEGKVRNKIWRRRSNGGTGDGSVSFFIEIARSRAGEVESKTDQSPSGPAPIDGGAVQVGRFDFVIK
jgi:hypothetical protein